MSAVRMPRLSVKVDDLLEMIEQHDAWAGALPPAEAILHRQRFADIKDRAQALYDAYPIENEYQQALA